ncbi:hypothetical protein MP228_006952 [Amoeboaphelidium protococcarum]|nr:hypothetical protein MP228_006952 [Amoeboaphelidium protococcarum]
MEVFEEIFRYTVEYLTHEHNNHQNHLYQHDDIYVGNKKGFWGPSSSTVDWCEVNYERSYYIAEFFNTVSSLAMVVVGLCGVLWHLRLLEKRYLLGLAVVCVVGVGSICFHGTLLFALQMLDELPMIYSALIMTFCVLEHTTPKGQRKYPWLPYILTAHSIMTTALVASPALYPKYSSPLLQFVSFHLSFAALELFLIYTVTKWYFEEKKQRQLQVATLQQKSGKDENKKEIQKLDDMLTLHLRGLALWLIGIGCWVADYCGCEYLWEGGQSFRLKYLTWKLSLQFIGLPRRSLILSVPNPQLHAWWHICASSGLYMMCIMVAYKRLLLLGKGNEVEIRYYLGIVPYICQLQTIQKNKRQIGGVSSQSGSIKKAQNEEKKDEIVDGEIITADVNNGGNQQQNDSKTRRRKGSVKRAK